MCPEGFTVLLPGTGSDNDALVGDGVARGDVWEVWGCVEVM